MTPTPRTDAQGYGDGRHPYVPTEFARQLERELAEVSIERDSLIRAADKLEADKEYNARLCESLSGELAAERENHAMSRIAIKMLQEDAAAERALADRLALSLDIALGDWSDLYATHETPAYDEAQETLAAWKQARATP